MSVRSHWWVLHTLSRRPRDTHIFVVDAHSLSFGHVDTVCGPDPSLPEIAIYPGEVDARSKVLFSNGNDSLLCIPECSLVVPIFGFFDTELFCIPHFLSFKLEELCLLVHPFQG